MTDSADREQRFTRLPRTPAASPGPELARAKLADSLDAIENLLRHAVDGGRDVFARDSPAYACGSMVVIRTAALFETDEFDAFLGATPAQVRQAIITTRHIASHSGYRSMNDDVFWRTLTVDLPPYLASWRQAVEN